MTRHAFASVRKCARCLLGAPLLVGSVVTIPTVPAEVLALVVVAHAGGKANGPENTLPTISNSLDMGADWVEVDVRLTFDGVAMLMHDATVDRTTDGTGLLNSMTEAEAKTLDAGSYFAPEFTGTEVPTFEEALAVSLGRGVMLVDMKDSFIGSQVADAIANLGANASDIVLWVTTCAEIVEAQTFLPGAPIFFQTTVGTEELIQQSADLGVDGISILDQALTASGVAFGHSLGLEVHVWGANSRSQIAEALFYGVDGVHHLDPAFALDFVAEDDCSDTADNDQDGFSDFPDDPGCASPTDGSEWSTLACDDGIDNDADGLVDFPADPGCSDPLGQSEVPEPAAWLLEAVAVAAIWSLRSRRCASV